MINHVRLILGLIIFLSSHSSLFNQWLPKSSFSEILVAGQSILQVGPFLDDDEFTKCTKSIRSADWNFDKKVDRVEFNIAIAIWTNDAVPALESQVSLPINAAFNEHACVELRFCTPSTPVCCEQGFEQYISIDFDQSLLEQNLFQICAATESAIKTITDSYPSAAPSNVLTAPTMKPTLTPSSLPTEDITLLPSSKPTSNPTFAPTKDPTSSPSINASLQPSFVPSSSPTKVQSALPSAMPSTPKPTSFGSVSPTFSVMPSSSPTNAPSENPTIFQSFNPSAIPSAFPSSIPSSEPSYIPSSFPSSSPTDLASGAPSTSPSSGPTEIFSGVPSTSPSSDPTKLFSDVPSTTPSSGPTKLPSSVPSISPSGLPSVSFSPTRFGRLMITLTYGLRTDGFDANAILSEEGNTIGDDLISAVTTIVLSLIDEQSQNTERLVRTVQTNAIVNENFSNILSTHKNEELHRVKAPRKSSLLSVQSYGDRNEGSRRMKRKLVEYHPDTPVFHRSILQDVCDPPGATDQCIIVRTVVTLYLNANEDDDAIRTFIVNGFNQAINDGTFFTVLSQI